MADAIMDARDFVDIVAQQDTCLIGYNLKGKKLQEAYRQMGEIMAAWDSSPMIDKLRENCALFNYCPRCGAPISELLGVEDTSVEAAQAVRVRRYRTK
jgi:hypothetical protein